MSHTSHTHYNKCAQLMLLTLLLTFYFLDIDILGIKLYFILKFYYIIVDRMSSDKVDLDRALGGDLWVVQETEQLQRTFIKWLDH